MSLIRVQNVSVRFEQKLVLRETFFRLREGDRVGLIGDNGSGKTTFLRLLMGRIEPTEGSIERSEGLKIRYFSQFSELSDERTVEQHMDDQFAHIHAIQAELDAIEKALDEHPGDRELKQLLHRQAELFEAMDHHDGWSSALRIDTVLTRLGFPAEYRSRPVGQLSGGWRNRSALAQLLLSDPDILLLDEPTNFLDTAGLDWLEEWLAEFRGAAVVVTHDRDFLEHVAGKIVEVQNFRLQEYEGTYSDYVRAKPQRQKMLDNQFQHEQELLALEAENIADRREDLRDPSKALLRRLANIRKRATPRPVDRIVTALYKHLSPAALLLEVKGLGKGFGGKPLFGDLSFVVQRGERMAILGPNGCGKTTLVRTLTLTEPVDVGTIRWSHGGDFVSYNQVLAGLDPGDTPHHALNVTPLAFHESRKKVGEFLAMMRFSEAMLQQKIGTLSGGQQARVALGLCLLSGSSVIVLDEPTNHLDLPAILVMERALVHFPGAIILVSHDRFFIDNVATRLLEFQGGGQTRLVEGNWTIAHAGRP